MNHVAIRPQPRLLDFISLCTGGGGLDLGLELAIPGACPVCLVEREAFAVAHLVEAMRQGLMAPAPVWSDARTFRGREWRGLVDGIIGGIPCQPHSLAGRKRGSHDERDLWSDARRIIVQARPWFVLIENVSGMLAAGDDEIAGALRVRRDLRRLGFEVEGGLFTAAEVSAPHQRERLFVLGLADYAGWGRGAGAAAATGHGSEGTDRGSSRELDDSFGFGRTEGRHDHGKDVGYQPVAAGQVGVADADSERLEGVRADTAACRRPDEGRSAGLCDGAVLVDAAGIRRGEGWPEPGFRSGRDSSAGPDGTMGDAALGNGAGLGESEAHHASARFGEYRGSGRNLFPPGPGDLDGWRDILAGAPHLEPSLRRVADGLASGLDDARIERLRMLGNGVVPLEAGYAVRTLLPRLAAAGSSAAAFLVRVMEGEA